MYFSPVGLSSGLSDEEMLRRELLQEWWSQIRIADDPGATTWEVLGSIERHVTDCLIANPPRLAEAESWTAQALLRIAGQIDS
jgi:hypothetical protein